MAVRLLLLQWVVIIKVTLYCQTVSMSLSRLLFDHNYTILHQATSIVDDWAISSIIPSILTDIIQLITKAKTNHHVLWSVWFLLIIIMSCGVLFNKASCKLPLE